MNTVLSNTRNANLQIITALAIMILVLLAFAVVPSISVPQPATISETSSRNAYVEFLSGEKVLYGNPARLNEAFSAYLAGEKATYANAVDASNALSAYHLGEKTIAANTVEWSTGLSTYLLGEKAIYTVGDAVSTWSAGEKAFVRPADVEAAVWDHRMGEKGLK